MIMMTVMMHDLVSFGEGLRSVKLKLVGFTCVKW